MQNRSPEKTISHWVFCTSMGWYSYFSMTVRASQSTLTHKNMLESGTQLRWNAQSTLPQCVPYVADFFLFTTHPHASVSFVPPAIELCWQLYWSIPLSCTLGTETISLVLACQTCSYLIRCPPIHFALPVETIYSLPVSHDHHSFQADMRPPLPFFFGAGER